LTLGDGPTWPNHDDVALRTLTYVQSPKTKIETQETMKFPIRTVATVLTLFSTSAAAAGDASLSSFTAGNGCVATAATTGFQHSSKINRSALSIHHSCSKWEHHSIQNDHLRHHQQQRQHQALSPRQMLIPHRSHYVDPTRSIGSQCSDDNSLRWASGIALSSSSSFMRTALVTGQPFCRSMSSFSSSSSTSLRANTSKLTNPVAQLLDNVDVFIFDCDGVIWRVSFSKSCLSTIPLEVTLFLGFVVHSLIVA
jgi:hypothetical protein